MTRKQPPVEPGSGYYATTAIADHGIGFLAEHAANHRAQPFFLYLAFNAPHFPLQARADDIERYRGRYRDGWGSVRAERAKRIADLGIVNGRLSDVERSVGPPYDMPNMLKLLGPDEVNRPLPWDSLSLGQRAFQAEKMAIHAAMVDRMDREIGRVLAQLRTMGAFDDTLIFFLSDNGASAEIMVRDDGHDQAAPAGSARTHLVPGPWLVQRREYPVSPPQDVGSRRRYFYSVDCSLAEGDQSARRVSARPRPRDRRRTDDPGAHEQSSTGSRSGRAAPARPGLSLVPAFDRDGTVKHEELWWEHEGNRAIRVGDLKLVAAGKDGRWELYDLATDRTETKDLAREQPEKVRELARRWEERRDEFAATARQDLQSVSTSLSGETKR